MPTFRVTFRLRGCKPGQELAGDAYIVQAKSETGARRMVKAILKDRFPYQAPVIAYVTEVSEES